MDDSKRPLISMLILGVFLAGTFGYLQYRQVTNAPAEAVTSAPAARDATASAEPTSAAELSEAAQAERARHETRVSIRTPEIEAVFTDRNASLVALTLLEPRFRNRTEGANGRQSSSQEDLVSTRFEQFLPMRQTIVGVTIPLNSTYQASQVDERTVRFTWEGDGFRVTRTVQPGAARYTLASETRIENLSTGPRPVRVKEHVYRYVARDVEGSSGMFSRPSPAMTHGYCQSGDAKFLETRDKLLTPHGIGPGVRFAGWGTNYFAMAMAPSQGTAARCVARSYDINGSGDDAAGSVFAIDLAHARQVVAPGAAATFRTTTYVGPKDLGALQAAGHHFEDAVDLGFFGFIARGMVWLLRTIHGAIGNWGLAIILLTLCVRVVLYPLTAASLNSMGKMRLLKPELDRIQAQYGDDQEKRGAAMMALYKEHSINPFAGCLPSLAQMPIWLALYTSLSTNIELYHASFLVWRDLSAPDPWFVLPAALAALMFLQQKMTPTTMDPVQAKIMLYMMPGMMGLFMLFLPAGLCVYMLTNSTLGIAQQKFVQWRLDQTVVGATSTSATNATDSDDAGPGSANETSSGKKGSKRGRA